MNAKEKRHANRKVISLRASVSRADALGKVEVVAIHIVNLSHDGALIESPELLFAGEVCVFDLVTNDAKNVEVQGRVAWVNPLENNVYRAGVAFRNLSADEEYLLDLTLVRAR